MNQDFCGKQLRGRCFKGQNLTGADFSYADIRGANFTNAILKGANFSHAKAGLQNRWATALFIVSLIFATLSGFVVAWASLYSGSRMLNSKLTSISLREVTVLIVFAVFFVVTIRKGFWAGLKTVGFAILLALQFSVTLMMTLTITGGSKTAETLGAALAANRVGVLAGIIAGVWTLLGTLGGALAVALAVAGALVVAGSLAGVLAGAVAMAVAGALVAVGAVTLAGALIVKVVWAEVIVLVGIYAACRALAGDEKFALIRRLVVAFTATRGTSFQGADLTDADFTQATLKNTNLINGILKYACWFQSKKVDWARVGGTILIDSAVRDLVVTKKGKHKSFVGRNLQGANLTAADLSNASLMEADLSGANLQGACLERANLTKTQALGTNFKRAKFTGACLEAWNIDSTTQLDGVICDYVYLLNDRRERRPSSGEFAPGDFTKLFQEVLHTVDLIFRNGIDWKAFTYSFKKLQVENEDIELSIQGIENKGDGVVVVRVNVPTDANKAKIHTDFTQNYQVALEAVKERYQVELNSRDEQIAIYRQHQADLQAAIRLLANSSTNVLKTGIQADSKCVASKLVAIKIGKGDFEQGFPVTLQIGSEGSFHFLEVVGGLPPAPALLKQYYQWQSAYQKTLKAYYRLDVPETQVTNVSRNDFIKECYDLAEVLRKNINIWLDYQQFRPIKERLLEQLIPTEEIRVIWQTEDNQMRRLPWHLWDFFERYPKAEIALSSLENQRINKVYSTKAKVRILAILGNSTGININKDREILEQLLDTEVVFLVEPQRQELDKQLWFQPWDILFFAGHSSSQMEGNTGQIYINQTDSLSLKDLKNALKAAIAKGLQLAIFNSCDGLGLARELANLHISQIIVMREAVPDLVAQEFLKHFLQLFAAGQPLYLAVREARERLQGLEDRFPCASWLPTICQNSVEVPTTWEELRDRIDNPVE
jgi:uncharacterized protein YjbI with pentapeptide repeats